MKFLMNSLMKGRTKTPFLSSYGVSLKLFNLLLLLFISVFSDAAYAVIWSMPDFTLLNKADIVIVIKPE